LTSNYISSARYAYSENCTKIINLKKKEINISIIHRNQKILMESEKVLIAPPSTSFAVLNLISLAILYAKLEKGLYVKWWVVMFPTNIFFGYSLGKVLYFISRAQVSKAFSTYSSSKLIMVWKFT